LIFNNQKQYQLFDYWSNNERPFFRKIALLVSALGPITKGHCLRVAVIADWIAVAFNLTFEQRKELFILSLVHDIGKSDLKNPIVKKLAEAGRSVQFNKDELAIMRKHVIDGYEILKACRINKNNILNGVLNHHERYNDPERPGYPNKLQGNEISFYARLLTLADVLEARTSILRQYRSRISIEEAIEDFCNRKGKKYDPAMAKVAYELFNEKLKYESNEGILNEIGVLADEIDKLLSQRF